jgi:oligopeptide/dipeptide ABC transporter ATP-binding protein
MGGQCRTTRRIFDHREKVIEVRGLKKYFTNGLFRKSVTKAVDGVSFEIGKGETFGLVGESGCGKSTVGRCTVRLIKPTCGEIFLNGTNISSINGGIRTLRKNMQIIFQDADGALNPRMKVYDLLIEPLKVHRLVNEQRTDKVAELMEMVNLSHDLTERYPHELSGGQRQRIGIARAVSVNPEFIVADEAAASLDLLVQAQMLNLLKRLQSERGISCLFISHNLSIIRLIADTVAVMYLGRFVEIGKTKDIFNNAVHPYTQALLSAVPSVDPLARPQKNMLKGEIPSPLRLPSGCRFHTRCSRSKDLCSQIAPEKRRISGSHWAWCHYSW